MAFAVDWVRPTKPHIRQKNQTNNIFTAHCEYRDTPKSGRNHIKWWKIPDMTITVDWDIEQEINKTKQYAISCNLFNFNSLPWLIQNSAPV